MSPAITTIVLLILSNAFMTFAWYYHVNKKWSILVAIVVSWLIALPEYILQVPANRIGHQSHGGPFSLPQLKILQEAITLTVFLVFTIMVAREKPRSTDMIAMGLVLCAVVVSMLGRTAPTPAP